MCCRSRPAAAARHAGSPAVFHYQAVLEDAEKAYQLALNKQMTALRTISVSKADIARAKALHPGDEFPADFPSRFKKEGAILEAIYGTPQTAALNKKLRAMEERPTA